MADIHKQLKALDRRMQMRRRELEADERLVRRQVVDRLKWPILPIVSLLAGFGFHALIHNPRARRAVGRSAARTSSNVAKAAFYAFGARALTEVATLVAKRRK